jgi:protein archease
MTTEMPTRWRPRDRAEVYSELEHPADLYLEIHGRDLPELVEHALFAVYDQTTDLEEFEARAELTLRVGARGLDEALRSLMSEALYHVETEGFIAVAAAVQVDRCATLVVGGGRATGGLPATDGWTLAARLWGELRDRERHPPLTEIKAVTYHHLEVEQVADQDWRARVLLDV